MIAWVVAVAGAQQPADPTAEWAELFDARGLVGTVVVVDERHDVSWTHDALRASQRFSPASTFKIPHSLVALQLGVVQDEWQVFVWDGTTRAVSSWNGDQTLRTAVRRSAVWVFQDIARAVGPRRELRWLRRLDYGNAEISDDVDLFWLDGSLAISAQEQVEFLQRLYRNELPAALAHQRLVKDVMVEQAADDWILRAKSGWAAGEVDVAWWVGWVEHPEGAVFFALNYHVPEGMPQVRQRAEIGRAVLRSVDAIP
ncbi:MAG: class D beta-lactamase [Myxococcales bacterium]|nr:class D beta-lactamase [Myxococcales bacterium]